MPKSQIKKVTKSHSDFERIKRALSQPIYLINQLPDQVYVIGGVTNVYTVDMKNLKCSCPDFQNRKKNCKHIFFTQFKIEKTHSLITDKKVKKRGKIIESEESCCICLEAFDIDTKTISNEKFEEESFPLTFCEKCSHVFHKECMNIWKKHSCKYKVTCPQCRSVQPDENEFAEIKIQINC